MHRQLIQQLSHRFLHFSSANLNQRHVSCLGSTRTGAQCLELCPYTPHIVIANSVTVSLSHPAAISSGMGAGGLLSWQLFVDSKAQACVRSWRRSPFQPNSSNPVRDTFSGRPLSGNCELSELHA